MLFLLYVAQTRRGGEDSFLNVFSSSVIPIWLLHSIALRWMGSSVIFYSWRSFGGKKKKKKDENIGQTKLMFSLPNLIYGKVGIFFWSVFREKLQWLMNYCVSNVSKNLFYRSQRITWHCLYSGQQHVVRTATAGIKEAICESPSFLKHRS